MVRITRLSFDDGMDINHPVPRDAFGDDDLDDFIFDEMHSPRTRPPARREPKRIDPDDRRPDRRQLTGEDWVKRGRPEERAEENENPV
jgi:hypothetical protein